MKLGFITLGCDKNTVDSERYLAQLADRGAEYTGNLEEAQVIVINTCGFIDAAKKESVDAIVQAGELKAAGSCLAVVAAGLNGGGARAGRPKAPPPHRFFFLPLAVLSLVFPP